MRITRAHRAGALAARALGHVIIGCNLRHIQLASNFVGGTMYVYYYRTYEKAVSGGGRGTLCLNFFFSLASNFVRDSLCLILFLTGF